MIKSLLQLLIMEEFLTVPLNSILTIKFKKNKFQIILNNSCHYTLKIFIKQHFLGKLEKLIKKFKKIDIPQFIIKLLDYKIKN